MAPLDNSAWQLLHALPLAAGEPTMDAQLSFRIVSRALHIVCAIILGGGIFYIRSILAQAGPDACFADRRQVWARWVAFASAILLASGLFNFWVILQDSKLPGARPLGGTYHMLFGIKLLLGLGVMFIAALVAGKTAAADRARANLRRWLNYAWTGVLAIVIIGAMLRALH